MRALSVTKTAEAPDTRTAIATVRARICCAPTCSSTLAIIPARSTRTLHAAHAALELPVEPPLARRAEPLPGESRVDWETRTVEFQYANLAAVWDRWADRVRLDQRDAPWSRARRVDDRTGDCIRTPAARRAEHRLAFGERATERAEHERQARGVTTEVLELAREVVASGWRDMRGAYVLMPAEPGDDTSLRVLETELLREEDVRLLLWLMPVAHMQGVDAARQRVRLAAYLDDCAHDATGRQPKPWSTTARRASRARTRAKSRHSCAPR